MRDRHGLCLYLVFGLFTALAACASEPRTAMVRMSDGAELATDYYLPAGKGPFPVILIRTPYGKETDVAGARHVKRYTSQGYAFVIQDVRGTGKSSAAAGARFACDGWGAQRDGAETVDWILDQPWCDGKIGTREKSAMGVLQMLLAGSTKRLAAQVLDESPSSIYGQWAYQGGVMRWAIAEASDYGGHWTANPSYNEFWARFDGAARAPEITAPALHIGGWFDIFSQGTIDGFTSRQHRGGEGAKGNQKLVMGPWSHHDRSGQLEFPDGHEKDVPPSGKANLVDRFLAYWLKGEKNGIMDEPTVLYYTMGAVGEPGAPGDTWRTVDRWPPSGTRDTAFYLGSDGALVTDVGAAGAGALAFSYDPGHPVPTRGGQNLMYQQFGDGPHDQKDLGARPDVLVFRTPPLEAPLEVSGRVRVRLHVSSSAVDTDFTAKLLDVYPDGREMLFLDGIQRVKYRNGFEKPDPLPVGQIGEIEIDLWSTSLVFNRGHRIGLHVSSSNAPRFEPNPLPAQNTVHMGSRYPSALILPVSRRGDKTGG
ncbi:MAG TPA: CocE/NonD family hydrolase [Candidatus Hydrogenedentes bacterium]|nr:CocE/NonD family hydrolase [Candidatus Hydrogenedentota bacterium]